MTADRIVFDAWTKDECVDEIVRLRLELDHRHRALGAAVSRAGGAEGEADRLRDERDFFRAKSHRLHEALSDASRWLDTCCGTQHDETGRPIAVEAFGVQRAQAVIRVALDDLRSAKARARNEIVERKKKLVSAATKPEGE